MVSFWHGSGPQTGALLARCAGFLGQSGRCSVVEAVIIDFDWADRPDHHTVDFLGFRVQALGGVSVTAIDLEGHATDTAVAEYIQNLVLSPAVGVGPHGGLEVGAISQAETDGEGAQVRVGHRVVSLGDSALDTVTEVGLGTKATAQDTDKLEQLLGGLGVGYDFGVADGVGEQVQGGLRDRVGHGGASFLRSEWWL